MNSDRPSVLIMSAARKVPLVRAFQAAMRTEGLPGEVLAADVQPLAAALYAADRGFVVPRQEAPGYLEFLLSLCAREGVGLLIPTRDEELPFFSHHRDAFSARGVCVMVAAPGTIGTCQDKQAFLQHLAAHRFAFPRTYGMEELAAGASTFPLFAKPRVGKGGTGLLRIADTSALADALASHGGTHVFQEFVTAPEYTVDVFCTLAGELISAVPRERSQVVSGESWITRTVPADGMLEEVGRLVRSLQLVGHNTVQCFRRSGERPLFIEVNPRFGGAANLGFAAGHPTPQYLLRLLHGLPVVPVIGAYKVGLTMLRHTADLFVSEGEVLRPDA